MDDEPGEEGYCSSAQWNRIRFMSSSGSSYHQRE